MGSEHYCLRWNNHQSNLLGVFSQLLQDESLVDVTLACSEGASIRAHKVVLSACSSYFQSLFLDHPSRHPIVILKDVRFSELRTLVEFMYKGEVNVQYCQLSALLKTAESLKVKGLAEMTNQSTALREPEREQDRLRPPTHPTTINSSATKTESLDATKRLEVDRSSPSPTRLQSPPTSLAFYPRKNNRDYSEPPATTTNNDHTSIIEDERDRPRSPEDDAMSNDVGINMTIHSNSVPSSVVVPHVNSASSMNTDGRPSSRGTTGISTSTTCTPAILAPTSSGISSPNINEPVAGPSGLAPVQSVPLEIDWDRSDEKSIGEYSSEYRHQHDSEATEPHGVGPPHEQGGPIYQCMYCGATFPHQSKLTRHILSHSLETLKYRESTTHLLHLTNFSHELPPQHFTQRAVPPLETLEPPDGSPMDIEFAAAAAAAAAASGNSTSVVGGGGDQGSVVLCKFCGKSFPDVSSLITHLPVHTGDRPFKCEFCGKAFKLRHHMKDHCRVHTEIYFDLHKDGRKVDEHNMPLFGGMMSGQSMRCPTPFAFPFNPLGLALFDTDPSRILSILHHQTLLAEEALRYRGIILSPKDQMRYSNPLVEMLSKEQELLNKRASLFKTNFRQSLSIQDLISSPKEMTTEETSKKRSFQSTNKTDETVQKIDDDTDDCEPRSSKSPSNDSLYKRASSFFRDGHRFNPLSSTETSSKEKSPSSSTSSTPPLIKPIPESALLQETIEEETKCVVCNAIFPSVWLLEQHAALQHANLGPEMEKPFICEQCGQSYRYRSAYVKHREQNHRARLPADKLFTCDVCGMQFRYLKSFKKHRLNHALERLHGKNGRNMLETNSDLVTSSNETNEEIAELQFAIKTEEDEEDQDDTVDSPTGVNFENTNDETGVKISSSDMEKPAAGLKDVRNFILKQPSFLQPHEPESSMPSTSINSLINAERIPNEQALGLNPQEASILNFLRVDAAEKQRDRRNPSRFACPFCGKCVRSKENLKLHVRKHTGERPFVCLFCGRAFGGKSDLTRHLRIHTGERPYHCEACGKCFARADYLSKHLTTHVHNSPR